MNDEIQRRAARLTAKRDKQLEICRTLPDGYLRQLHAKAATWLNHFGPRATVQVDALALQALVDAVRATRGLPPVVTAIPTDAEREAQR